MKMTINARRCPQNHRCPALSVCPQGAISQKDARSLPNVDAQKCTACGKCIRYCPMGAFAYDKELG